MSATFTLTVNGQVRTVADGTTIADLVAELTDDAEAKGIAVAVDRWVIPRSEWASTAAAPGTLVEVVTAAAGG